METAETIPVEPDLDFIQRLGRQGGDAMKQCFQCGTCSATCALSPDAGAFPSKEMAWAGWGMKDRLLADPDVWLCYHCNDCSERCPRKARPGDVLAAVRQACVLHYAYPRFLGRWVSRPAYLPLLLGLPAVLLTLALFLKDPLETMLGISHEPGQRIVFAYSSALPHWLLNSFFILITIWVFIASAMGVKRFWRAMKAQAEPAKGLLPSMGTTLKSIVTHDRFSQCTQARPRYGAHLCVFFGFLALGMVSIWVITARVNPLIRDDFIYPFGFWNPWKILANAGGLALIAGCLLMAYHRLRDPKEGGTGSYFDWTLIAALLVVVLTGFITELLHYVRLEPHRQIAYFVHLVFVSALLLYLPYSKLAHLLYRTTARIFAEHTGRMPLEREKEP